MASIKIHADICRFERKRSGLTTRQWVAVTTALVLAIGSGVIFGYALGMNYTIAITVALCLGMPALIAGFMPIYGMHAETFLIRHLELTERGDALMWSGASLPPLGKEEIHVRNKKKKQKGYECAA